MQCDIERHVPAHHVVRFRSPPSTAYQGLATESPLDNDDTFLVAALRVAVLSKGVDKHGRYGPLGLLRNVPDLYSTSVLANLWTESSDQCPNLKQCQVDLVEDLAMLVWQGPDHPRISQASVATKKPRIKAQEKFWVHKRQLLRIGPWQLAWGFLTWAWVWTWKKKVAPAKAMLQAHPSYHSVHQSLQETKCSLATAVTDAAEFARGMRAGLTLATASNHQATMAMYSAQVYLIPNGTAACLLEPVSSPQAFYAQVHDVLTTLSQLPCRLQHHFQVGTLHDCFPSLCHHGFFGAAAYSDQDARTALIAQGDCMLELLLGMRLRACLLEMHHVPPNEPDKPSELSPRLNVYAAMVQVLRASLWNTDMEELANLSTSNLLPPQLTRVFGTVRVQKRMLYCLCTWLDAVLALDSDGGQDMQQALAMSKWWTDLDTSCLETLRRAGQDTLARVMATGPSMVTWSFKKLGLHKPIRLRHRTSAQELLDCMALCIGHLSCATGPARPDPAYSNPDLRLRSREAPDRTVCMGHVYLGAASLMMLTHNVDVWEEGNDEWDTDREAFYRATVMLGNKQERFVQAQRRKQAEDTIAQFKVKARLDQQVLRTVLRRPAQMVLVATVRPARPVARCIHCYLARLAVHRRRPQVPGLRVYARSYGKEESVEKIMADMDRARMQMNTEPTKCLLQVLDPATLRQVQELKVRASKVPVHSECQGPKWRASRTQVAEVMQDGLAQLSLRPDQVRWLAKGCQGCKRSAMGKMPDKSHKPHKPHKQHGMVLVSTDVDAGKKQSFCASIVAEARRREEWHTEV